ncbi:hypothetical protein ABN763_00020 [Spongiivirga sp. MCCC 1A20706]|uniref:hypothetical protein n=1 Tax=Spongiivirga sp. MCCC 1A20706 TaxID=3160963 RepID=UPI00397798FF
MGHSNSKKDQKAGRIIGIVLLVLGMILTTVLVYIISTAQSVPRILIAGPSIGFLGLAMSIFPGGNLSYKEINKAGSKKGVRLLWSVAPNAHKTIWIVSGIIGLITSFKILLDQGF